MNLLVIPLDGMKYEQHEISYFHNLMIKFLQMLQQVLLVSGQHIVKNWGNAAN